MQKTMKSKFCVLILICYTVKKGLESLTKIVDSDEL